MSCELFVGNLNPEVRMRDLENCFGRYGKIVRCDLKKNFGFIQLGDKRDAEEAIRKENNRRLLGSVMTVEWAKGSVGDQSSKGGGRQGAPPAGGFRKPRSPTRLGGRPGGRDRSPLGGTRPAMGRDRSPVMRPGGGPRSNGFSPRDNSSGGGPGGAGGRRISGGRENFDTPRFDRGPPRGSERFPPRERFQGTDRFNDRGANRGPPPNERRGPPPRENGFSDRPRANGGFNERRQSFSERRNFGGGGPRRF